MPRCLLIACILLSLFLSPPPTQAAMKRIVFIRYPIPTSHFNTVVDGFKKTMSHRGFQENIDVEYIDILTHSADQSSVPEVVKAVEEWQHKADLFVTSGWVSMSARSKLKESTTPQLFVPVLESVALKMLHSVTEPPNTNLSGLYLMYPPEKILRLARLLIPDLNRYAYVFDSRIPADMVFKSAYEHLPFGMRHGITIHFLDLAGGVDLVLSDLKALHIEAFGGVVGSFQNRQALAASNLPVITALTLDIEKEDMASNIREGNILAGLYNPFRYCGEQAAEMAADIFSGTKTIGQSIPRPAMQLAFINMQAAKLLNIQIPFIALESVDLVIK
ncbi:MAG: hypothetical protein KKD73_13545 [Proteobacteria bacterium]|nr:hypothetical protein [Pseudomonadota bacterium]MBU1640135.1 hypothetical protein [Pseudomonadota bacterium]